MTPHSASAAAAVSSSARSIKNNKRPIFCDMDGVLCDFNSGVMQLSGGRHPDTLSVKQIWKAVGRSPHFFLNLDWTHDGKDLWMAIRHLEPDILSGVPSSRPDEVGRQKAEWCRRHFRTSTTRTINHVDMAATRPQRHAVVSGTMKRKEPGILNVISCWSKFKYRECVVPGSILIDDREKLGADWIKAGGTFVHHINTEMTIQKLRDLNVL